PLPWHEQSRHRPALRHFRAHGRETDQQGAGRLPIQGTGSRPMNVVDRDMDAHSPDPRSLAEAEDWFARLRTGNCTPRERVRFERWRAGADHAAAYAETERLWRGMDGLSGHPELQRLASEALRGTEPRHGMASRRRGWRLPVALAA